MSHFPLLLSAGLYNVHVFSPVKNTVVVNDRWGKGVSGKHGGFLTYSDHFDPGFFFLKLWSDEVRQICKEDCKTLLINFYS